MQKNINLVLTKKGFTIIELLVVIAIIAVLTAIVLVNVTAYVAESKNSAMKGDLDTAFTNAIVFYDGNSTYVGEGATKSWTNPKTGISNDGGTQITEQENLNNWCACANLLTTNVDPSGTAFCVDSTGAKNETKKVCGTSTCSGTATGVGAGSPTCQ